VKTRELPRSLWRAWRLRRTPVDRLGTDAPRLPGRVLVSLTSIPSRLGVVPLTIRSLLAQTVRPDRIVLWLNEELDGAVPEDLRKLEGSRFEVRYRTGTSPHRKLVGALREFPDHLVIVCDDDHMYPRDWLARLHREHLATPESIVGNECRRIVMTGPRSARPYGEWVGEAPGASSPGTLAIGYGGVAYPSGSLHEDAVERSLYLELAPRADDLWFKAMARRVGTRVRRATHPPRKPLPILRSQRERLGSTNIEGDGNRRQWELLVQRFPEVFTGTPSTPPLLGA